jgi:N-acetylglucosamine kinase-like BadF-type ATPase
MAMNAFLGIDGGGSSLRVVAVDGEMNILAEARRGTANPSSIGRDASKSLTQGAIREILSTVPHITAAGIGIAGAAAAHSADWLDEVIKQ